MSAIENYLEREVKYHVRGKIAKEIRNNCTQDDPMVSGVTVMLGTVLAMAAFSLLLHGNGRGRSR